MGGEQDMRKMGGLKGRLPVTFRTMLIGTIAIAGIPPLAGFFSKDEILASAFASGHYGVWIAGLLGATLTAFYMFRLYLLCFRGESRLSHEADHHLHESPAVMIAPLVVLAVLSVVGGWVGLPFQAGGHAFERWLEPVFAGAAHASPGEGVHLSPGAEWMLIAVSVAVAAFGIVLAFRIYGGTATAPREEPLAARAPAIHRVLLNKYWVDEFYQATVVRFVTWSADRFWRFWDTKVVDGTVNGVAYTFEGLSAVLRLFQTGLVGTYALFITLGVAALIAHFLRH
jgi:NADH-quinone oxidoreductase subunit L